jgi:hypothetical protein
MCDNFMYLNRDAKYIVYLVTHLTDREQMINITNKYVRRLRKSIIWLGKKYHITNTMVQGPP